MSDCTDQDTAPEALEARIASEADAALEAVFPGCRIQAVTGRQWWARKIRVHIDLHHVSGAASPPWCACIGWRVQTPGLSSEHVWAPTAEAALRGALLDLRNVIRARRAKAVARVAVLDGAMSDLSGGTDG